MARSKVKRLPPEVREAIDGLLREDRHTLDELIAELQRRFPAVDLPSRSGLHRHQQGLHSSIARIRDMQEAARIVVSDLGENPDDKIGGYMVAAVTAACGHVAMRAAGDDELDIREARDLARMAKDAADARGKVLGERQAIERAAEERLKKEQQARLTELGKSGAIDPAALALVMKAAYDL